MDDDALVILLAGDALYSAHPQHGNDFAEGLRLLHEAERITVQDSPQALRLDAYRGVIFLWHNLPSGAVAILRGAAMSAGNLGYYTLRNWIYGQFVIADTHLKSVRASQTAAV